MGTSAVLCATSSLFNPRLGPSAGNFRSRSSVRKFMMKGNTTGSGRFKSLFLVANACISVAALCRTATISVNFIFAFPLRSFTFSWRDSRHACAVLLINYDRCASVAFLAQKTDSNSGMHREVWRDLTASSAVNLPITNASLWLVVMRMGVGSTR